MDKRCFGLRKSGEGCNILTGNQDCNGLNTACKFYKTVEQAIKEEDDAILNCRSKGLCTNCKYMQSSNGKVAKPCSLSTEGK